MFFIDLYAQIFRDRIVVRNLATRQSVERQATEPFSHPRALVGNFTHAQATLQAAVGEVVGGGLLPQWRRMVVHPMALVEGGLTQVEDRLFHELASGVRMSRVVVWTGAPLSDDEIQAKLKA